MLNRLAVIIVADIVGYSRIMADDEAAGIKLVKEINDNVLLPSTSANSGEILKRMGDGWILAFGSVQLAIACSLQVLESLSRQRGVQIRIGAHIGEIVQDDDDFYGAGVNIASRLQGEAPPGGMMISEDLYRQLTGDRAKQFEEAGSFQLKNIPYPITGYQWRPKDVTAAKRGEVSTVVIDPFEYAPHSDETHAFAHELRDQVLQYLSRRTGVRTVDNAEGTGAAGTYRLRGRFRQSGTQARMTVTMLHCESGEALFSRNYDGDVTDIFAFADRITAQINADLRVQTNAYDANRIADLPDDELSISELRSRAAHNFYRGSYASWSKALELMERAVTLNPEDPMSLGMRALAIITMAAARYDSLDTGEVARLESDLNHAIHAAPKSDFLHACRAQFLVLVKHDGAAAMREAQVSLAENPTYIVGKTALAYAHMQIGDLQGAIETLDSALKINTDDPLIGARLFPLAVCNYLIGNYERCGEVCLDLIQNSSEVWTLHKLRFMAMTKLGNHEAAEACRSEMSRLQHRPEVVAIVPPLPESYADFIAELYPSEDTVQAEAGTN